MKQTDILIDQLARSGARPSGNKRLAFSVPLVAAAMASVVALTVLLDTPFQSVAIHGWVPLISKWVFTFAITIAALSALYALAHPGRRSSIYLLTALAPLAAIAGLAMLEFTGGLRGFPGATWRQCLMAMGTLGTLGMASAIYALRVLAPVRLRRAGFAAGLFGGGLAASAYAPFCTEPGAIYLLVFYCGPIMALALFGWLTGPKLLRW